MKRITVVLPDGYDDAVTITAIGLSQIEKSGIGDASVNLKIQGSELDGHDGDVLVIHPDESAEWRKPETGWIPVEERLPETGTRVFVREGSFTAIGCFGKLTQKWFEPISGAYLDNVTHWMPLPEPPEVRRWES